MSEFKIFQVEKPWGNFRQFTHNLHTTVKILTLNGGEEFSLQSHTHRTEFWHVLEGRGTAQIGEDVKDIKKGDELVSNVGEKHRIAASPGGMKVLEISTGDFDEEDIIRYEDKYGRA